MSIQSQNMRIKNKAMKYATKNFKQNFIPSKKVGKMKQRNNVKTQGHTSNQC
jgi:hypothetical protein